MERHYNFMLRTVDHWIGMTDDLIKRAYDIVSPSAVAFM